MAHKRSSKKTSFGKKSGPEKDFIKRGRNSRKEDFEDKPKRSYGRSSGLSIERSNKTEGDRFEKRPRKSFDGEEKRKRPFSKSNPRVGKSRWSEENASKKDSRRSFNAEDKPKRSFNKDSGKPNRWPKKDDEGRDHKRGSDRPFSDRKRNESGEFKQGRSVESLGFTRKAKTTAKRPAPLKSREAGDEPKNEEGLTRLNKYIANSGMGSRREADEMIKKGLISVNGVTIIEMGFKVKQGDVVRYEDKVLKAEKLVYVLLNKPKGFITTTVDPKDRKTVMNLVANACKERLYPVGRLDRNTTGLLLLTNDGALAEKLTHPSHNTKKIYKVELDKALTKNDFQKIQDGVHLEEGKAMVDDIAITSDDKKTIGIELHIGWNRIVRRIFESLEYEVVKLDRVIFAGLDKKDLPRGEWRFLKPEEVVRLKHFK